MINDFRRWLNVVINSYSCFQNVNFQLVSRSKKLQVGCAESQLHLSAVHPIVLAGEALMRSSSVRIAFTRSTSSSRRTRNQPLKRKRRNHNRSIRKRPIHHENVFSHRQNGRKPADTSNESDENNRNRNSFNGRSARDRAERSAGGVSARSAL
ncbi:hypothetical protein EVAR_38766_1 [Eumeta japonica]|uniref:Uncharacterized protein n=1 Tax=Eumeta variegata TaxID=151549 RepID=A0A4C1WLJ6_EUMVA|nr:hypothetical protein EVAR_38766_1 [Eumeta japonica]